MVKLERQLSPTGNIEFLFCGEVMIILVWG